MECCREKGKTMTVYTILYKDIVIGRLEIDEAGRHRYTPREEGAAFLANELILPAEMRLPQDWGKPIPIFQNKIRNAERFGRERDITSFTDHFRMILEDV